MRRGGGICEVGFFVDGGDATVNPHQDICRKEITLVGSWVYTVDEYPIAYNFMRRAEGIGLPVEDLITHRFGLGPPQRPCISICGRRASSSPTSRS